MTNELELLEEVRGALADEFDVVGFLGRSDPLNFFFLARELASRDLVALRLTQSSQTHEGRDVFEPTIVREIDASVPDPSPSCPRCNAALRPWAKFCTQCRLELSGVSSSMSQQYSREELFGAVCEFAQAEYQVLGDMRRRDGSGFVYFALRRSSGELVTLRLKREAGDQYQLAETRVIKPLPSGAAGRRGHSSVSIQRRVADPPPRADRVPPTGGPPRKPEAERRVPPPEPDRLQQPPAPAGEGGRRWSFPASLAESLRLSSRTGRALVILAIVAVAVALAVL